MSQRDTDNLTAEGFLKGSNGFEKSVVCLARPNDFWSS